MTIFDMLGQSGVLTLLGMGVVFGFLVILIFAVTIMGKVVHAVGADKDLLQPPAPPPRVQAGPVKTAAVAAAITAAVTEYQASRT